MTCHEAEITTISIVESLFNFIKDNFDRFGHQRGNWWYNHNYGKSRNARGNSWAPFIEACFVKEGMKNCFKMGHCYRHKNVEYFISDTFIEDYNETKFPCDSQRRGQSEGIDVSCRTKSGEYFLALECSEDPLDISKVKNETTCIFNGGTTADGQLRGICDEIYKLITKNSEHNIIVSRPHIRNGDNNRYQNVVDYFKNNIEMILSKVNPPNRWIIILIAPDIHVVNDPKNEINIIFHCYEWKKYQDNYSLIKINGNYSFAVKMDNSGLMRRC